MYVYPAIASADGRKMVADLTAEPMTAEFWAEGPAPHTAWMFVGGADHPSLVNVRVASEAFVADADTTMVALPNGKLSVTAAADMVRSSVQAGLRIGSWRTWEDAMAVTRRGPTLSGAKYRALAATGVRFESDEAAALKLF